MAARTLEQAMGKQSFRQMNELITLTSLKDKPELYEKQMDGIISVLYSDIHFKLEKLSNAEKITKELYHYLRVKLEGRDIQAEVFK